MLGGALGLVAHDAAVGIQVERQNVAQARRLHGLVEGRKADHHGGAQHLVPENTRRWMQGAMQGAGCTW